MSGHRLLKFISFFFFTPMLAFVMLDITTFGGDVQVLGLRPRGVWYESRAPYLARVLRSGLEAIFEERTLPHYVSLHSFG